MLSQLPDRPRRDKFEYDSPDVPSHRAGDPSPAFLRAWMHDLEGWGKQVADDIMRLEMKVFETAQAEPGDPPPPPQ
ncbi:MAG: hypothetical protein ACREMV_09415 [Gemmatimonadales bacterium]